MSKRVLVVATSRKTRGGITSVVKAHETGVQWQKYHCKWIETHRDGNSIRKLFYLFRALVEYICLLPFYDIVHIHIATTQSARRKKIFFCLAKWLRKKIIFHFHPSNEKFLYEEKNRALYTELFSQADLVLVLSEQWRRWIKEALGLTKNIEILYNPCPSVNRREDLRKKQILFAGSIIPRKGYDVLLKAFAKIASKHSDWKLVFAGNGEVENGTLIAEQLGIRDKVSFLGWVKGEQKEQVFQESSVYCLASDGEGFPMGVLDAWVYGVPCVVTPVGGLPDIVVNEVNGLIFDVGNIDMCAKQLDVMLENEELRKKIVRETDKYVHGEFHIKHICERIAYVYENI